MLKGKRTLPLGVALAAAATLGATVLGAGPAVAEQDTSAVVAQQLAAENVALLRGPLNASDKAPAQVAGLIGDVANVAAARRTVVEAGRAAYIVPGEKAGTVCYSAPGAATCGPTEQLETEGLVWTLNFRPDEPFRFEGIAADGVTEVQLELSDGRTLSSPVVGNGFAIAWEGNGSQPIAVTAKGTEPTTTKLNFQAPGSDPGRLEFEKIDSTDAEPKP